MSPHRAPPTAPASDNIASQAEPAPHGGRPSRWLTEALTFAAVGLLPLGFSRDPLTLIVWIALCAASLGVFAGARGLPLWPWSAVVPALWMMALAWVGTSSRRVLPTPAWATLAWFGLFLAGWGLGRARPAHGARFASVVLLVTALVAAAPIGFGLVEGAFPPRATAWWLAASPTTWSAESAGVDWLRHPALYEPARTVDLGPEMYRPFRGALAGPLLFLVGCLAAWIGVRVARSRSHRVSNRGPAPR